MIFDTKWEKLNQDFNQRISNWSRITSGIKNQEVTKIVDKFPALIELPNTIPSTPTLHNLVIGPPPSSPRSFFSFLLVDRHDIRSPRAIWIHFHFFWLLLGRRILAPLAAHDQTLLFSPLWSMVAAQKWSLPFFAY